MKLLTVTLLACLCYMALADSAQQCRDEFQRSIKCFIDKADQVVDDYDVDLDAAEACVREKGEGCRKGAFGGLLGKGFGGNFNPEEMKECAQDALGPVREQMQQCIEDKYPGFELPEFGQGQLRGQASKHPGLKLIALGMIIKKGSQHCAELKECLPANHQQIKAALCDAKATCFADDLKTRCADAKKELRETVCQCYKNLDNKQEVMEELKQCMGSQNQRFANIIGKRLEQQAEDRICNSDFSERQFNVCDGDDVDEEPQSNKQGGRGGGLLGRLRGGGRLG